jgi:hypothetical protein
MVVKAAKGTQHKVNMHMVSLAGKRLVLLVPAIHKKTLNIAHKYMRDKLKYYIHRSPRGLIKVLLVSRSIMRGGFTMLFLERCVHGTVEPLKASS